MALRIVGKHCTHSGNIKCVWIGRPQIHERVRRRLITHGEFGKQILLGQRLRYILGSFGFIQDVHQGRPGANVDSTRLQHVRPINTF